MADKGEEEPLKALVFADSCTSDLDPSTPEASASKAASLPLLGAPVLHWQLYTLAISGVDEAIVLSSTSGVQLLLPESPLFGSMKIIHLSNPAWCSPGDALRDVEARVALRPRHDFIIVHHGALFNINVASFLKQHKARSKADRNWLVSIALRKRAATVPLVVGVQETTGALCYYAETAHSSSSSTKRIQLDPKSANVGLCLGGTVQMLADVVDVGLDICSPDFLLEFRENYDFDNIRGYVQAKLDGGEAEILGNRIYAHFVDSRAREYGTRINTYAAYMAATHDVLDGWMLPIRTSRILNFSHTKCVHSAMDNVLSLGEACAPPSRSGWTDVVLGSGAVVEDDVILKRCFIGDKVHVERGSRIEDSVVLEGSKVAPACTVLRSLIMNQSTLSPGMSLMEDCFVDSGVTIDGSVGKQILEKGTWVTKSPLILSKAREGQVTSNGNVDATRVSNGLHFILGGRRRFDQYVTRFCPGASWPEFLDEIESDVDDEIEHPERSDAADTEDGDINEPGEGLDHEDLQKEEMEMEIRETVERGVRMIADLDAITLEVRHLTREYELKVGKPFPNPVISVIHGILNVVLANYPSSSLKGAPEAVREAFTKWEKLVKLFCARSGEEQQRCIVDALAVVLQDDGRYLMYLWNVLYDLDVLEEEAFLEWASSARRGASEGLNDGKLLESVHEFIDWLENAEEED